MELKQVIACFSIHLETIKLRKRIFLQARLIRLKIAAIFNVN